MDVRFEKEFRLKKSLRSRQIAKKLGLTYEVVPKFNTRPGRIIFKKDGDLVGRKIGRGPLIFFVVNKGSSLYKRICEIAVEIR